MMRATPIASLAALVALGAAPSWAQTCQTFNFNGGVQQYTVPPGVIALDITAQGGGGGDDIQMPTGGRGAIVGARVVPNPSGETLQVLVAGQGSDGLGAGGGGGSFVYRTADLAGMLVAAGGGGGASLLTNGGDGQFGTFGQNGGGSPTGGFGGVGGLGGTAAPGCAQCGAGGGGVIGDGQSTDAGGGRSVANGGAGGATSNGADGGFGGGGEGEPCCDVVGRWAAGGGGFSGGGGGGFQGSGGGGGSFNVGTRLSEGLAAVGHINGTVVICQVPSSASTLSVADLTIAEGDSGTTPATVTVTLSPAAASTVTVDLSTADGTATVADSDYVATTRSLVFLPGETTTTVDIPIQGDRTLEPDETFTVQLSTALGATIADGTAMVTITNEDLPPLPELAHGASITADLSPASATPGVDPGTDLYPIFLQPRSSYEVIVDATSGDVQPLSLDRLTRGGTLLQLGGQVSAIGDSVTLRFENGAQTVVDDQRVRVRSGGCTTTCGADDVYRIRAYDTTYAIPRFNNAGSQVTVLAVQNPTDHTISGVVDAWSNAGALLGSSTFSLSAQETLVMNTASIPGAAGQSGSITVMHTGGYGELTGKTVALEPSTGFSFDTPMLPRVR